jgi:hypothetical protein
MRTTAEIVREAAHKAMLDVRCGDKFTQDAQYRAAMYAATYACELAQADAAALLEPVRMRSTDGGTRRE